MKYLDCIELLNLALQTLKSGQRDQVPLTKLSEVQTLVLRCKVRAEGVPMVQPICDDLLLAVNIAQQNKAVRYLSHDMRDSLVKGLHKCLGYVCEAAWEYYSDHDVPLADETFPLLRTVVEYHFLGKGA